MELRESVNITDFDILFDNLEGMGYRKCSQYSIIRTKVERFIHNLVFTVSYRIRLMRTRFWISRGKKSNVIPKESRLNLVSLYQLTPVRDSWWVSGPLKQSVVRRRKFDCLGGGLLFTTVYNALKINHMR